MTWELEGLISHLLMLISCAGEQGCPINEIVDGIKGSSGFPNTRSRNTGETFSDQAAATIWRWLVDRSDVSVGVNRKYNENDLQTLLAPSTSLANTRKTLKQTGNATLGSASNDLDSESLSKVRVFVSEGTMWEVITGHSVNYKRVPRLEWLLLLGIASTKAQGILQGDLGRLVGQDKRSVPKRTDSLLKKGYIVKRTTLVRGTKTSKLWLKSFAPPLPKESDNQDLEHTAEINMSYQTLAANLDQVPWHTRWTGDSMDFHALATTIMTVAREWQVIRLQDLKAKLGVLGLRWQMKIVSKICRFLNSRGAIQYVAAKLDNKVYKDCIRFNRDLSSKDWTAFLATGKRSAKPMKTALMGMAERADPERQANISQVNGARLRDCPPWTVDDPLPQKIAKSAQFFGTVGVTNPEIYVLTLGPTFNRYISSLTSCMANSNVQPPQLEHLQLKSEHIRVGKVASYRFYTSQPLPTNIISENHNNCELSTANLYGFSTVPQTPKLSKSDITLSSVCGVSTAQNTGQVESKKRGRPKKNPDSRSNPAETETFAPSPQQTVKTDVLLATLRVSTEALRRLLSPDTPVRIAEIPEADIPQQSGSPKSPEALSSTISNSLGEKYDRNHRPSSARCSGGAGRGRGRPAQLKSNGETALTRLWVCKNCGGTWKNDIGLKYHLEKSRSSCNVNHGSKSQELGSQGKISSISSPQTQDGVDADWTDNPLRSRHSIVNLKNRKKEPMKVQPKPTHSKGGRGGIAPGQLSLDQPRNLEADVNTTFSPSVGIVKPWRRSTIVPNEQDTFSLPKTDQGLLFPQATKQHYQDSLLQKHRQLKRNAGRDGIASSVSCNSFTKPVSSITGPLATLFTRDPSGTGDSTRPIDSALNAQNDLDRDHEAAHGSDSSSIHTPEPKQFKGRAKYVNTDLAALVQGMLNKQSGAIMGGKPLWDSILTNWNTHFGKEALPSKIEFQSTVNHLLKNGTIFEHWHAFRDSSGLFSKCQLLTSPGIDAFSAQSLELLERIKKPLCSGGGVILHPDSNVGLSEVRIGGRGRRTLAREVATLHAPVYVAQVAAKKDQETVSRDRVKMQRRSLARDSIEDFTSVLSTKRQKVRHFASLDSPIAQILRPQALQSAVPQLKLQFLEPNHYIGQETPGMQFQRSPSADGERLAEDESLELKSIPIDHGRAGPGGNIGHATENETLHDRVTVLATRNGVWPTLSTQYFEQMGGSFTLEGWMPDAQWLEWENFSQDLAKRSTGTELAKASVKDSSVGFYQHFLQNIRTCFAMEMTMQEYFARPPPGPRYPYNIFVGFSSRALNREASIGQVIWPAEGQLDKESDSLVSPASEYASTSGDDDFDLDLASLGDHDYCRPNNTGHVVATPHFKAKRIALVTRALTSLPQSHLEINDEAEEMDYSSETSDELMAAFVAVRTLMGGADKSIDWGLLLFIYPDVTLRYLRKFWDNSRKQQEAHISTYTRAFQERLILALENGDLPMINYDNPQEYVWKTMIRWTMEIPRQEGFELPRSRKLLHNRFILTDTKPTVDDWRERFFHVQASVFARFEAVTSQPAALAIDGDGESVELSAQKVDLAIARSWVKSLCGTGDSKYCVETIRDKLFTLLPGNKRKTSTLFKEAIDQLTKQRIICKSKKPPLGGRPYRLNEGYLTALNKMAQTEKYDGAARFKLKLDAAFRKEGKMAIPYSFSDGAMIALTNLNAAGRITLLTKNLPYIPLGFEPGNYESRKFPKSYYQFGLEAAPTETYLYNDEIIVLQAAYIAGPPLAGHGGELPQWVDIFGVPNEIRWSKILGGFCFAMATRGSMDVDGICSVLNPVLDIFEANLIVDWGKKTGVIIDSPHGHGLLVGEWWWLAVPWLRRR